MTRPARRVIALAHDPAGPSARYRIANLAPHLAPRGYDVELRELPRGARDRRACFEALPRDTLVVLQRVLLGAGETRWLRRAARWLVYDVDDALPFRVPADGGGRSSRRSARFRRLSAAADVVAAGNEWIAEQASPHAQQVRVIPTAVDVGRYPADPVGGDGHTLVWIGQPPTLPYLESLIPPLSQLAVACPGLRLRLIGASSPALTEIPDLALEERAWSGETEVAELQSADVGLAPLSDDDWSRGKCGLRLLQYGAAGLAAVASPVGTQGEIVAAGGAVGASSAAGWVRAIADLLGDRAARRHQGAAGRALVVERYSVAVVAARLADALDRICDAPKRP